MLTPMTVKGLDERKYSTNKYIRFKLYILGYRNSQYIIALIERELYIMDNLNVKALISIDILALELIILDIGKQQIKIRIY